MIVIHNETFQLFQQLERTTDNDRQRKQVKYTILDRISEALGRAFRNAKKVAAVIDEIVYKATDRGYSFNGRETLAAKVGVSLPTVDRAIKLLKESDQVIVAYRENPNSNGVKTPVIIFKNHPNFAQIAKLLNVKDNVVDKVENPSKPTETSDSAPKKVSTYSLPSSLDNSHLNVSRRQYIKMVPKNLQHFQAIFGKQVKELYGRVWLSAKKLGVSIAKDEMQRIGYITFEQLKEYVKGGRQLSKEELCKLAYKISYNQLEQRIERHEILDTSDLAALVKPIPFVKATRSELDELGVY